MSVARLSNNPPTPIEYGESVVREINAFLQAHPVIENEDMAREAKPLLDRAKLAFEEIEAERDSKVRPLNEQVATINLQYKAVHNTDKKKPGLFDKILVELQARIAVFLIKEEEKRLKAAEEAQKAADEAERIARGAEAAEREALANASEGELDIDVAGVTRAADSAFGEFEQASRFAARAEKATKVKIGGGFGRTAALRDVETLHLESFNRAIKAIGPDDGIRDAVLTAARVYRKVHGHLPDGVTATTERKI